MLDPRDSAARKMQEPLHPLGRDPDRWAALSVQAPTHTYQQEATGCRGA